MPTRKTAKKTAKKAPTKHAPRTTRALTPQGLPLRGSVGALILKDLGITDAQLAAFLPPNVPTFLRAVLWCQFEGPPSLDAIGQHFAGRFAVTRAVSKQFPPTAPTEWMSPRSRARPRGVTLRTRFMACAATTMVKTAPGS